ncbi:hypothetical protein DND132_1535 [Pseudodesulfovibrio mercurii]|uniref:Periplasmic heavy metal sensor n=1 Tax=Pseudodesulfovibrio mercurii TaxID=641491 RepID=F0JEL3_9BACT|nr:hypothetical protein [Pseudodesulfovibrio mercurii]EGB14742.1 hypothetical protein DND132_1535 [Pseudodesulfovibrio mercurii]
MKKWKIWTAFLAVFLAGALSGVAGTGLFLRLHFAPPKDREAFRAQVTERLTDTLSRELDLTDEAALAVRTEVIATLDRIEGVHAALRPKAEAIIADGIKRVKGHLTETQQAELDELIKRNREKPFGIFRLPPPPPPPPFP